MSLKSVCKQNIALYFLIASLGLSISACDEGALCRGLANADLIVQGISEFISGEITPEEIQYDLFHDLFNSAAYLANCEDKCSVLDTAGTNTHQQNIYYSQTGNGNDWGNPVNTTEVQIDPLAGCQSAKAKYVVKFLVDGYYLIESIIDAYDDVPEGDEDNNRGELTHGGKSAPTVIFIEGLGRKPKLNQAGDRDYVEVPMTEVLYQ